MKVLVVGSLNMDSTIYVENFPLEGETITGVSRVIQAGGKGANQAVAVSRGHTKVTFIGAVANDENGRALRSLLEKEEMNLILETVEGETGNATIIVNKAAENKIIIIRGANYKLNKSIIDKYIEEVRSCDYILLQNEICPETNEYLLALADKYHKKVVYNPAPYKKIKNELLKYVTYITPNESELNSLTKDHPGSIEEKCKYLHSLGVKNVIVTLGIKGLYYSLDNNETGYIDAFKVKAVDTVAAGDTFNGYFLCGLCMNKSVQESLTLASKASSIAVTRKGAIPSIPYLEEVIG